MQKNQGVFNLPEKISKIYLILIDIHYLRQYD